MKEKERYLMSLDQVVSLNPFTLRKTKNAYNFGLSECSRVNSRPFWEGFVAQGS